MEELSIRKACTSDSEFIFTVKKAAYREYIERVWGWDDTYQQERHNKEFASHDFHIIQFRETDVGFFITSSTSDTLKVNQIFILPEYQGVQRHRFRVHDTVLLIMPTLSRYLWCFKC